MKKIFTLVIIIFASELVFSQSSSGELLIVYIHSGSNKVKKVRYYTINPEPGVIAADALYKLRPVSDLLPADDDPGYYEKRKERFKTINQDSVIYNYFESESAALNYVVSKGWKLVSSITTILTAEERGYTGNSYGNTYTVPKYLFVRE